MRKEEAKAIGGIIETLQFKTCINLGAGNVSSLQISKPWIQREIFNPMTDGGKRIFHTDIRLFPGVDHILDLGTCDNFENFRQGNEPMCNVLEHVRRDTRVTIINNLTAAMKLKDSLVVSVPYKYPYHADPIDALFRPSSFELKDSFKLKSIAAIEVASTTYLDELRLMKTSKRLRRLMKPLWPIQSPKKYRECVSRLSFLFRPYVTSVFVGIQE